MSLLNEFHLTNVETMVLSDETNFFEIYLAHKCQCQDSNPKAKIAFEEEEKVRRELLQHLFCVRYCY